MTDRAKIIIRADLPLERVRAFFQHVRDFDVAHDDCHFEVLTDVDTTDTERTIDEMVQMLRIDPEMTFFKIFERKR